MCAEFLEPTPEEELELDPVLSTEDNWLRYVKDEEWCKFPERYVSGLTRVMAEALWERVLKQKPGLVIKIHPTGQQIQPPLHLVAGRYLGFDIEPAPAWAVGKACEMIEKAKICAAIAEKAIEEAGTS